MQDTGANGLPSCCTENHMTYWFSAVLTWYFQLSGALKSTESMFCSDTALTIVWSSEAYRQYVMFWNGTYNGLELWTAQTACFGLSWYLQWSRTLKSTDICCVLTWYLQWSRALNSADSMLCSELWHNHSFRTSWLEWRSFLRIETDSNRKENRWLSGSTNFVP